jgi:ATP-binding cassette subfamily F protein uup
MSILCSLKNLNLSFGNKTLFKDATLTIQSFDRIGLLGLNGHGKSSLFKILAGPLTPDTSTPPFIFDKSKNDYSVFLVPQELILESDDLVSIKDYFYRFYPDLEKVHLELLDINERLAENHDLIHRQKELLEELEHGDGWNIYHQYESYLKYFGLYDFDRPVRDLSGGEQKKILLALGLSTPRNLVLWDEPTNHLDLETIKKFETEMSAIKKTFILVSHDRYLLSKLTDKIFHIQNGKIRPFDGSYQAYLKFLAEEEHANLLLLQKLKNSLSRETDWMRQGIKARGVRSKSRVESYHQLKDKVSEIRANAKKELDMTISSSQRKSKKLVELKDICMSYDKPLFKDINLIIGKGDKIGLLGPNGVGKSTLVNIISGIVKPQKGTVKAIDDLKVQYFSQKREELDPETTPFQLLGDGDDFIHLPDGRSVHVSGWFESFLFNKDNIHRPLKTFSGGERNRLQMALNLTKAGDLWIFDEPTNDLDLETLQILETKLKEFKGSLILISHDRAFLSNTTNKVWLLDNQTLESFNGGYEQVEAYLEARELEKQMIEEEVPQSPSKPKEKKKKQSNKEKERIKFLEKEMPIWEAELEGISQKLENFDYSNMDQDTSNKLAELTEKQQGLEEMILEGLEELDELIKLS